MRARTDKVKSEGEKVGQGVRKEQKLNPGSSHLLNGEDSSCNQAKRMSPGPGSFSCDVGFDEGESWLCSHLPDGAQSMQWLGQYCGCLMLQAGYGNP